MDQNDCETQDRFHQEAGPDDDARAIHEDVEMGSAGGPAPIATPIAAVPDKTHRWHAISVETPVQAEAMLLGYQFCCIWVGCASLFHSCLFARCVCQCMYVHVHVHVCHSRVCVCVCVVCVRVCVCVCVCVSVIVSVHVFI